MFLILQRNRDWWAKAGPPGSGARVQLGGSRVIFQYFPGKGLQLHPLANFGKLNGYWQGKRNGDLRSLADDLVELGVERNGFLAWEYYFAYGGGSPPWISGMAQGTAMQALARAGNRLNDPALLEVAARARGAFERNTPTGVRVPQSAGDWYALYSFAPRLYVLNGHLQAVNGMRTYAEFAPADTAAVERFSAGDVAAQGAHCELRHGRMVALLAAVLEAGPGGERQLPHAQPRLRPQPLPRDRRCPCTAPHPTTSRSTSSRTRPSTRTSAVPSPAVAGKGVQVPVQALEGRPRRDRRALRRQDLPVHQRSFQHGERYIRWIPPRVSDERTYTYTLFAKDLVGNTSSADGRGPREGRAQAQGPR